MSLAKILTTGGALLLAVLFRAGLAPAQSPPLYSSSFAQIAPPGFGDRQNSGPWSMLWWNDHLYVGTVRAFLCWTLAYFHQRFPLLTPYPPEDPNLACAPEIISLPLQAEIWRWTASTNTWERVYQSPQNVLIPGLQDTLTARDMGYRAMAVFTEPGGTEALYVGGVTSNLLWPPMPPPRILRSTDGIAFDPIPQSPGTLLGSLGHEQTSFRSMEVYKGRLYVLIGEVRGQGRLLEAEDPAGGNNNFRWATPEEMEVFEVTTFNGFLYLGLADLRRGYAVVKTDATGTPPYTFTPVVTRGAYAKPFPSKAVVSMGVFNGSLYVGTDNPTELIRINPDDSWDLLVGEPRQTPQGWKYPLSGLGTGFNWPFNEHFWRLQAHQGALYVGTFDQSKRYAQLVPALAPLVSWAYGFDLYRTSDGYYFSPITMTGFGDPFQTGIRTFASTPLGLFAGTVDYWYGLRVWQGIAASPVLAPPDRLEGEYLDGRVVLSWEAPAGATSFRVFRSDFGASSAAVPLPGDEPSVGLPGPFREVGTTSQLVFEDTSVQPGQSYQYYVVAEDSAANVSDPSNLVRAPSLAPPVTFTGLMNMLIGWGARGPLTLELEWARAAARVGHLTQALRHLQRVQKMVKGRPPGLPSWRLRDVEILTTKLVRRTGLAQAGQIPASGLMEP